MLHRFATLVAAATVLLILAGSLVTSHGAGLSVPDWPTSYGWNMFTFPPSMWVANIFYEHGHRLIASTVGFLTIILAVWLWIVEPRRWMRWLGVLALVAVIAQGVLGGLTVLFFLPAPISTAHAGLAEIFFGIVVSIALFTSRGWLDAYGVRGAGFRVQGAVLGSGLDVQGSEPSTTNPELRTARSTLHPEPRTLNKLRRLSTTATVLIYAQILVGATMRHTGAGLAIPDFPLMFGRLVPPLWDSRIAVHFSHRVGAALVAFAVATTVGYVRARFADRRELRRAAAAVAALVTVQIALGAATVLSRLNPWINSVHVVVGALVLTTSLVLTLRSWRGAFVEGGIPVANPQPRTPNPEPRTQNAEPRTPNPEGARA